MSPRYRPRFLSTDHCTENLRSRGSCGQVYYGLVGSNPRGSAPIEVESVGTARRSDRAVGADQDPRAAGFDNEVGGIRVELQTRQTKFGRRRDVLVSA